MDVLQLRSCSVFLAHQLLQAVSLPSRQDLFACLVIIYGHIVKVASTLVTILHLFDVLILNLLPLNPTVMFVVSA